MKKVIVITGGNSGLGRATVKLLVRKHTVVILGKNKQGISEVSKLLNCDGLVCDVTDARQIKTTFASIVKKYNKIDCVINCAGVWATGPIEENSSTEITNLIAVNVTGPILVCNSVVTQLKKQKSGRIINVISQAGLEAKAGRSLYYASKWAMTGFTKCLKNELISFNISVAGFYPGFIHTGLFEKSGDAPKDYSRAMSVEKVAKALVSLVEMDSDLVPVTFEMQSIKQI